jgi:hypothetical protein
MLSLRVNKKNDGGYGEDGGAGGWRLEAGCWILDTGYWKFDFPVTLRLSKCDRLDHDSS